jgi:2,4-dienoyl-CoA reductase-like NADH-dependent reductase (Old Yellow Enzyme family)/thioredoxin reductase
MGYPNLFQEGNIGKLTLKNRVVMPPMGTAMASAYGEITDHHIAYYEERAKGGVGLIIVEACVVDFTFGRSDFANPRVDNPRYLQMLYRLANAVHKYDARAFVQLHHAGRESNSALTGGEQIVAPSPVACSLIGETPRELTLAEIAEIENRFVMGALACKNAGMDGVQLHAAHGFLIGQFFSPQSNKRTDTYGGAFENRMRFAKNIVAGIKNTCGKDYPVIIRISADEFVEGGVDIDEGVRIAQFMEGAGVDGIDVSCGTYESFPTFIEPVTYEQGWRVYLADAIKKKVRIPVITVGVIREPDFAERILSDKRADFIAVGRGLITDPDWCVKAREGREGEIRKCISCLYCIDNAMRGAHLACAINARVGRELEFGDLERCGKQRKVVVVGGGPAGMEAARILAMRDFKVVLFEKEDRLGGQINFGNKPRGKAKMTWLIDYLKNELANLKIDVRLNTEADDKSIRSEKPYAVLVCTGGVPTIPDMDGIKGKNVFVAEKALTESATFKNEKIAVIGGGMTGCETAELFASQGNDVTLVEMLPDVAMDAGLLNKMDMMVRLKEANVHILTSRKLTAITQTAITLENLKESSRVSINVDKVVLALGVRPNNSLYPRLKDKFDNVFLLGDARSARRIADAIREGFDKGFLLE